MARYLLDTNILIMALDYGKRLTAAQNRLLTDPSSDLCVSAISVWEMAIKWRKGKLMMTVAPPVCLPVIQALGVEVIPLTAAQAILDPNLGRDPKDPFDRMIVAVAEQLEIPFITTDRALLDHPLAWRP